MREVSGIVSFSTLSSLSPSFFTQNCKYDGAQVLAVSEPFRAAKGENILKNIVQTYQNINLKCNLMYFVSA